MLGEQQQLEASIAVLEAQRPLLGDSVVESLLAPARSRLAELISTSTSSQQLKQVSILFLDVVGSTSLSQHLDPEEISSVMDGALARCTGIVEAHRGKVLQYAGDSLLGVFGADDSQEDDAEWAVRCGLGLLALGHSLGVEVQAAHGHSEFHVRVGIHTGGVLLGGGVDADSTIRGIAVNIAARLEQSAPSGALLISHDTWTQVRGLFEFEAQGPLTVKGVDAPIRSYLVTRAKPRSFAIGNRGIEGVTTKMIGRDLELGQLQSAFSMLLRNQQLAAITVVADAGIGKSRLLHEFDRWAASQPEPFCLFRGRASPGTQSQPFGLLRDILARHFQITGDDSLGTAHAKIEQVILPLFEGDDGSDLAEGHAHLLGHLIGIEWPTSRHVKALLEDPGQIRNRAFRVAAELFRKTSASESRPIVLQLDDLHWADNETLDFLTYLTEIERSVPLLILAFSRSTLFERRQRWCADAVHERLDLRPLDNDTSRLLVDELLKELSEIPAALGALISGGSDGNPFYMEELVRMLIDRRAIKTGETWTLDAQRLLATEVPSTVTGVLQARLDGLTGSERVTLQTASVIGPVFWDEALIALDEHAETTLPSLVRRGLVRLRAGPTINGLSEFVFNSAVLHQVTYATVLKRSKRELHGKVAHWLALQTGLRATEFLAATAEHFEQAGDEINAVEFFARAAEQARNRLAHEAVILHVARALGLLSKLPETVAMPLRWRLLESREATFEILGDREAQRADVEAMELLADALDDDRKRSHAARRRGVMLMCIPDWHGMEAAARVAATCAQASGDTEARLMARRMVATALAYQGDLTGAQQIAKQVLKEARALDLRRVVAFSLNTIALIVGFRGDDLASLEAMQESLAANEAAGDIRGEAIARTNVGITWLNLGDLSGAKQELEEGLRLIRVNGDRGMECVSLCAQSTLSLWQGDFASAQALAQAAQQAARRVDARDWGAIALCRLGDAWLAMKQHSRALSAFEEARQCAVDLGHPLRYDAAAGVARVALALADLDAAMAAIAPLLSATTSQVAGALEGTEFPRLIALTCHQVLTSRADPRAFGWLRFAHDSLQAQATRIGDDQFRRRFLDKVPYHAEIIAAWQCK